MRHVSHDNTVYAGFWTSFYIKLIFNSKWVLCIALSIINFNAKIQEYQSIDIKIFETVLVKCRFHVARFGAQQLLYNDSFLKQTNVPLQVLPSPVYPALHAHAYDPTVLVQTALTSQLWSLVEHSSTSENIKLLEI